MKKKYVILSLIFIVILIIAIIAWVVLNNATDLFKSESQMFKKYFMQSAEFVNRMADFSNEEIYINNLKEKNYTDNSTVKLIYTNSHGDIEEFNSNISGNTNGKNKNSYRKINVKYKDEIDVINTEFLNEESIYGILLSDVVGQYASVDLNSIDVLLKNLNISKENFEKYDILEIFDIIKNKKENIKNICIEFLNKIKNEQYTLEKDKIITLSNGDSITADEYIVKLTSNQSKKLILNLLEEINNKELINNINNNNFSELTITIYTSNAQTSRIIFNLDSKEIILDFYNNEINLKYTNTNYDEIKTINLDIRKEENRNYISYMDSTNNNIKIEYAINQNENDLKSDIQLELANKYIQNLKIILNQDIQFAESIDVQKKFEDTKNVILNNLNQNELNVSLNGLAKRINAKLIVAQSNIKSELLNAWINKNNDLQNNYQEQKNKEREKFNNQFISYEGENINLDIIYNLLEVISENILKYEEREDGSIKIYIEQGQKNIDMSNEIKQKLQNNNKNLNVSLEYNLEGKVIAVLLEESVEQN